MAATSSITTFRKDNNCIIYDLPSGKMVIEEGKEKRVKIEPSQGTYFYQAKEFIKDAQGSLWDLVRSLAAGRFF